jgi:hypothetical protein
MRSGRIASSAGGDESGWPWRHRKTFLERLRAQGYSCWTLRQYESATASFCAAIEKRELGSGQLDGVTTDRLQRSVVGAIPEYDRKWGKFCIRRFIDHLAEAGVAAVPHPPTHRLTARQRLHQEYEAYLRQQRGLAEGTIRNSLYYGERFPELSLRRKTGRPEGNHPGGYRRLPVQAQSRIKSPPLQSAAVPSAQPLQVPVLERQDQA